MTYVRTLGFEEDPDYNYMKSLLYQMADSYAFDLNDNVFDWGVQATLIE